MDITVYRYQDTVYVVYDGGDGGIISLDARGYVDQIVDEVPTDGVLLVPEGQ